MQKKTKVVIFGRKPKRGHTEFTYRGTIIETVDEFKYLGVIFTKNGNFKTNIADQYSKGVKAMYSVLSKWRKHGLSLKCDAVWLHKVKDSSMERSLALYM